MPRKTPPSQNPAVDGPSSATTVEALAARMLERALALRGAGKPLSDTGIDGDISALCVLARARGLPAEKLVVELKAAWFASRSAASLHDKNDVMPGLVSLCIREYFRDGGAPK